MSLFSNSQTPNSKSEILISYFRSGWAFLIPYLLAYLLYAWLKWPVNPNGTVKAACESVSTVSSQLPTLSSQRSAIPCLLHVYWFLHLIHLIVGVLALRVWRENGEPRQSGQSMAGSLYRRLWPLVPWLCLALIFWIPGIYLEWPSDPWEHLRRINEWRVIEEVTAHSSWMKYSYFIPYSLLTWCSGLRQIFWLNFYYTGICLLLCWQYYRLAKACNLGERSSMVFVLLQALLFGNNIFSFYRYYGISSSIYAQLCAVALIRFALEAAKSPKQALRSFFSLPISFVHRGSTVRRNFFRRPPSSASFSPPTAYGLLFTSLCLLSLIAFNHQQGLGIAALGIGAIIVWRLSVWKRSALWWLIIVTLAANILFLRLYPRSAIIETYRVIGFLNSWYGFNILDFTSGAGDRMMQIVSFFGLVNLAAAFLLFRLNHIIAWLTILPLGMLLLPCIAVPLAQSLARHGGDDNIITFQRMIFAIPPCLALVCFVPQLRYGWDMVRSCLIRKPLSDIAPSGFSTEAPRAVQLLLNNGFFVFTCLVLIAGMVVRSSSPSYNRLWNASASMPDDLQLRDIFSQYEAVKPRFHGNHDSKIITTKIGTALLSSYSFDLIGADQFRGIGLPAANFVTAALDFLSFAAKIETIRPFSPTEAIKKPNIVEPLNLLTDPKAGDPAAWIFLGGSPPEFASGIADLPTGSTALQNPPGASSHVFTSALIPIHALKTYRLEMTVRQVRETGATVFLAIAWYNSRETLLESGLAQPVGAGSPRGWVNGLYSYFGLVSQQAPTSWTTFGHSFGLNEVTAIPPQACFVRVGALLNYNATRSGVVQLTNVRLFEKATPAIGLAIPSATSAFSPTSQAAQLSTHWPPQQVMIDRAGTNEIQSAAVTLGQLPPD